VDWNCFDQYSFVLEKSFIGTRVIPAEEEDDPSTKIVCVVVVVVVQRSAITTIKCSTMLKLLLLRLAMDDGRDDETTIIDHTHTLYRMCICISSCEESDGVLFGVQTNLKRR